MIDKAVVAIQATGLFEAAMEKWHALDPEDQEWLDVKEHFGSAFNVWLTSGAGMGASQGYMAPIWAMMMMTASTPSARS